MNRHINFHGKVVRHDQNLTYRNYFSGEIGELRPVWVEDAVPGDTFQYHPEARLYFAPLIFPVLSSMKARIDVFFVPDRLCWSEWENFISGGPDNNLSPAYPSIRNIFASLSPAAQSTMQQSYLQSVVNPNSLLCNLGHPTQDGNTGSFDITKDPMDGTLPYRYHLVYDEYYRDEEKQISWTAPQGVRLDVYDFYHSQLAYTSGFGTMHRKNWAKDYFTTASLEQQRGGDIPLLTNPMFQFSDPNLSFGGTDHFLRIAGTNPAAFATGDAVPGAVGLEDSANNVNALESVLTINGLRYLYAASAWLNNNVVGGTRYIEQLRRRYKVVSSDARLQRPEMVGSIELPVSINVINQTSSTVDDQSGTFEPLGDRAGQASIIGSGKTLTYSAEEFGWFIGIFHVAPKAAYFQGLRRNLQKEDRFDFYMPEFERVPQREIRNNEIFFSSGTMEPETGGVFGYTGIYNELRHHNDEVHGTFQTSLLAWTQARKFSSLPSADSAAFLQVDSSPQGNNRIFAVPANYQGSHIFGVINNICVAKREVSRYEPNF